MARVNSSTARNYTFKLVPVDRMKHTFAIHVYEGPAEEHWLVELLRNSILGKNLFKRPFRYMSTTGQNHLWYNFDKFFCEGTYEECVRVLNDLGVEDY